MIIVICMKLAYFCDREQSMNSRTDDRLQNWKQNFQNATVLNCWLPMLQLVVFEIVSFAWGDGSVIGTA